MEVGTRMGLLAGSGGVISIIVNELRLSRTMADMQNTNNFVLGVLVLSGFCLWENPESYSVVANGLTERG